MVHDRDVRTTLFVYIVLICCMPSTYCVCVYLLVLAALSIQMFGEGTSHLSHRPLQNVAPSSLATSQFLSFVEVSASIN